MYIIQNNDDIDQQAWDKFLNESPTASWFQSYNCYQFYKKLDFLKPFAIAVVDQDKILALVCGYIISDGGLIKSFMSRRVIIPGGVLISINCEENILELLLQNLSKTISKAAIYTELRNYFDYSLYKTTFERCGYKYQAHLNFQVPSESVEQCLKQLSTTKRRDIKLSLKQGATISDTKDENEIAEFYQLLSDLYKTKIKTPLFPLFFFTEIVNQPYTHLFVVKYESKIIGGSLCVGKEKSVLFEWFVCGLDGRYKNVYPSTLATWAAIEYAAINDFKYFDMMGAGKPDEGYGVRDFKAKFGGELVEHGRFKHVCKPLLYKAGEFAITLLRKKK